jgi:hypothetical protein
LKKDILEYISEQKLKVVSPSAVARNLSEKLGVPVTKQYVHQVCVEEKIKTRKRKPLPKKLCSVCNLPVNVRNRKQPYDKHLDCWKSQGRTLPGKLISLTCSGCGVKFNRYKSQVKLDKKGKPKNQVFHSRPCQYKAMREGTWRSYSTERWTPKSRKVKTAA